MNTTGRRWAILRPASFKRIRLILFNTSNYSQSYENTKNASQFIARKALIVFETLYEHKKCGVFMCA